MFLHVLLWASKKTNRSQQAVQQQAQAANIHWFTYACTYPTRVCPFSLRTLQLQRDSCCGQHLHCSLQSTQCLHLLGEAGGIVTWHSDIGKAGIDGSVDSLGGLVLQHHAQLPAQRGRQGRRHCIANLPVLRVHIAVEPEGVREALQPRYCTCQPLQHMVEAVGKCTLSVCSISER